MKKLSSLQIVDEILRHEKPGYNVNKNLNLNNLPFDISSYADYTPQKKIFAGPGEKKPAETVSKVNKAQLRETLIRLLKEDSFRKNLPYIHLSYYPGGYKTVASFRVDCDKSEFHHFQDALEHATRFQVPMTWFVEVGAQEKYMTDIASIRKEGHDVQLHCYHHITYKNYSDNKRNIMKGKQIMEAAGIPVCGFASPFGQWNPQLNQVLEEMNFEFSSEFAMGYDDLPFYPVFKNQISSVLQIPVHPICMGSLRDISYSQDEMKQYFNQVIDEKYRRNSPIMLYSHPRNEMDQFPDALDFILKRLKDLPDVWLTTYSEFAKWWKERLDIRFEVSINNNLLTIQTENKNDKFQLRLERENSTETFIPLISGTSDLSKNSWSKAADSSIAPTRETSIFPEVQETISFRKRWLNFFGTGK